jgi:hypothetical protein
MAPRVASNRRPSSSDLRLPVLLQSARVGPETVPARGRKMVTRLKAAPQLVPPTADSRASCRSLTSPVLVAESEVGSMTQSGLEIGSAVRAQRSCQALGICLGAEAVDSHQPRGRARRARRRARRFGRSPAGVTGALTTRDPGKELMQQFCVPRSRRPRRWLLLRPDEPPTAAAKRSRPNRRPRRSLETAALMRQPRDLSESGLAPA